MMLYIINSISNIHYHRLMVHMKCVMCGLGLTKIFTDKLIMDEDNVHPRTNPTEQSQNGVLILSKMMLIA